MTPDHVPNYLESAITQIENSLLARSNRTYKKEVRELLKAYENIRKVEKTMFTRCLFRVDEDYRISQIRSIFSEAEQNCRKFNTKQKNGSTGNRSSSICQDDAGGDSEK